MSARTGSTADQTIIELLERILAATGGSGSGSGDMLRANNLSDVANAGTSRTNLGLGALATVSEVTDALSALLVKPAVTVVATTNLTLSGEQTIDGQLTSASIVLATGQTAGAENGPWVTAAGAWARPTWYTNGSTTQAPRFLTTFVRLGTLYTGSTWRMTTAAVTIGTTATTWVQTPISLASSNVTGILAEANGGTGIVAFGSGIGAFLATPSSSALKAAITDENAPDGASSKVIFALGSLSISTGKTGTFTNSLTLAGTDGSTLNIGTGGTLSAVAYSGSASDIGTGTLADARHSANVPLLNASNAFTGATQTVKHLSGGGSSIGALTPVAGTWTLLTAVGTDTMGILSITPSATGPLSTEFCTIAFGTAWASAPKILLVGLNQAGQSIFGTTKTIVPSNITTTQFGITSSTVGLVAGTPYTWLWIAIQ